MSQSYFSNHRKGVIGIILFFCVFIIILTFLQSSFRDVTKRIYPELYAWNIIPKHESFTELYFENHEKLPFEILPQQNYSFSFTIHNQEYKNMMYSYAAYLLTNNQKISLKKEKVFLHQNQKQTISVQFSTSSALPRSKVIVNLPEENQAIDFWINE
ncbi:MAG TPA: hypothetical protein VLG12_07795 [Candidatus Saccharimonadales bacterium]|nr:hypothetical protein [Candidatus Saccharimonadales bacterium]